MCRDLGRDVLDLENLNQENFGLIVRSLFLFLAAIVYRVVTSPAEFSIKSPALFTIALFKSLGMGFPKTTFAIPLLKVSKHWVFDHSGGTGHA